MSQEALLAQDLDISIIRSMTALSVVICHLLEAYHKPAAWWINFGVQSFMFISGSLFGGRIIRDWPVWFGKRARRILPGYYILITVVFLGNCFYLPAASIWKPYVASLFCIQDFLKVTLPGCDHLWYITLISLCYLTVPVLQAIRIRVRGVAASAAIYFLALPVAYYLVYKVFNFLTFAYVANFSAFAWGYWLGSNRERLLANPRYPQAVTLVIGGIALVLALRAGIEIRGLNKAGLGCELYQKLVPWTKVGMGATLFLLFFGRRLRIGSSRLVRLIAKNSYETYLTHHVFIFGTFSILPFIHSAAWACLGVFALTACSAVSIRRLTGLKLGLKPAPAKADRIEVAVNAASGE